jgi:hypothetical protein
VTAPICARIIDHELTTVLTETALAGLPLLRRLRGWLSEGPGPQQETGNTRRGSTQARLGPDFRPRRHPALAKAH